MATPALLIALSLPPSLLTSPTISIVLPVSIGSIIGYIVASTCSVKRTYAILRQPPGRPPAWVFAPVWTMLYGAMGYASYRVSMFSDVPSALSGLYTLQLGLNFAWMPLFYGAKCNVAAMVDIVLLTGCVGVLTRWYADVDGVAGCLMVPYLVWLGFAGYLTAGVGVLNGWDIRGAIERGKNEKNKSERGEGKGRRKGKKA